MTYKQLLAELKTLTEDHLEDNVTVCLESNDFECLTIGFTGIASDFQSVLDPGHFYLQAEEY